MISFVLISNKVSSKNKEFLTKYHFIPKKIVRNVVLYFMKPQQNY